MADVPELKSEKISPLREVQLDAEFNFLERIRQQEEKKKHEEAKAKLKAQSK